MNVAPLVFGLLAAFLLIDLGAGGLACRWQRNSGCGLGFNLVMGIAGSFAGGLLFGLAPLDVEAGLVGALLAAVFGASLALAVVRQFRRA
jgi:uncharacterized membrane protein YeaQ/YmgE (transglycosylase-associated protein family)